MSHTQSSTCVCTPCQAWSDALACANTPEMISRKWPSISLAKLWFWAVLIWATVSHRKDLSDISLHLSIGHFIKIVVARGISFQVKTRFLITWNVRGALVKSAANSPNFVLINFGCFYLGYCGSEERRSRDVTFLKWTFHQKCCGQMIFCHVKTGFLTTSNVTVILPVMPILCRLLFICDRPKCLLRMPKGPLQPMK